MSLANDSILKQPDGAGKTLATELVGGKEHEVIMTAGPAGHVLGTRDSYLVVQTGTTVGAANKFWFDLFNAAGSGLAIEIHGIWFNTNMDVATAATLGYSMSFFRTTSVGTGGNAFTENAGVVRSVSRIDPGSPALPAQITMRDQPTTVTGIGVFIGQTYVFPEESSTAMQYESQFRNSLRYAQTEDMADLEIPQGSGLLIRQSAVASNIGFLGYRIAFTAH